MNRAAENRNWYGESQQGFRHNRGCDHTLFISNRIDQLGIEKDNVVYKLFVDNTKAYDIVDRNTLWLVMKRRGIPDKFLNLIKSTLIGSKAKLKTKLEKECESFGLNNGLKQGAILSPCLFNIFMGAIMQEIRRRLKEHNIGAKIKYNLDCNPLSRNKKGNNINTRNGGGEVNVTDILFADDSCFIAVGNPEHMQKVAEIVNDVMTAFGQKVSIPKTKVMKVMRKKNTVHNREEEKVDCEIMNTKIEEVAQFQYVGTQVMNNSCMKQEIRARKNKMKANYYQFRDTVFQNRKMDIWMKLTMFRVFVLPAGLYNCAAWHAPKTLIKQLDSVARNLLIRIFGFKWKDHVSYDYIVKLSRLLKCEMCPVNILASKYRMKFMGRIIRSADTSLVKQLFYGEFVSGNRTVGRPETQWIDCIVEDLKTFGFVEPKEEWSKIKKLAMDAEGWENYIDDEVEKNVLFNWYESNTERRKNRMEKEGKTYERCVEPKECSLQSTGKIERAPLQTLTSEEISNLEKKLGFQKAKEILDIIKEREDGIKRKMGKMMFWTTQCVTHAQKRHAAEKRSCLRGWAEQHKLTITGKVQERKNVIEKWLKESNKDSAVLREEERHIKSIDRYWTDGRNKRKYLVIWKPRLLAADVKFPEVRGLPWVVDDDYVKTGTNWLNKTQLGNVERLIGEQMERAKVVFEKRRLEYPEGEEGEREGKGY